MGDVRHQVREALIQPAAELAQFGPERQEPRVAIGRVAIGAAEVVEGLRQHGVVEATLEQGIDEANRVFAQIAEAGVDYDDVTDTLEREGVQKFIDSFTELLEGIDAKRKQLVAA